MDLFTSKAKLRRFSSPLAVVAGTLTGGGYARQLITCGVPALLTIGCALAVFAVVHTAVGTLLEWLCGEKYRCKAPGCGFHVRLPGTDAGESRRWQEIAAAHPTHDHAHHP
ncbi:hypothetical protein ABZ419_12180 [Streptomyces cinnamoneus]|uniref:hypothetical protein n=1 Tax=Streptomyces cinnamoneus TaxID=53446 RepID=UPI0033DFF1DA